MSIYRLAVLVMAACAIAYFMMPHVIKLAHRLGAVDQPDQRKVHNRIMPRLGGLGIFSAFMIVALLGVPLSGPLEGVMLGAVVVFLVGMLDDIFQLSPYLKLVGQCGAAAIAIHFGVTVEFLTNPFDGQLNLGWVGVPLTFVWIVGITNAINLIDGLDGLAAGVSSIAAATMGLVAYSQGQQTVCFLAFILVAAIAGFLPYNFNPARTFMGDGGSNFLGYILACLAVMGLTKTTAVISLFLPIVILGIPIFDTFFAIIRRINNRAPIFKPDKAHLHHRLMAIGMSHRRSVLIIYAISTFFGGVALVLNYLNRPKAALVLAVLLMAIVLGAEKIGMRTGGKGAELVVPRQETSTQHS
ncbi:MAG: undecaprenyl/decaprenyl-phosphate alpha-N-acetylglucosaminyl 1-phosphate transferase [Syntrophomonadaceae bacterium]|nr:undecaprenyl/decaprenyl-phosphate alpha-N-acetylglucosaminyl 1-phosphate transferase [Syntrophomonadaceae bacterium]